MKMHSDADNALIERVVEKYNNNGKILWAKVAEEIGAALDRKITPGAVKIWHYRVVARDGVKQSQRAGDKTWERTQRWIENLLASNYRIRAKLYSKKGKRRASAKTELLKKKVKELREEIAKLKTELKSHRPILRWWVRTRKALKSAGKALIE
ncbi:hypothetical protein A3B19_03240 [Candidatus Giovannonibacteria bacterium RIFCSPLOWO2_01_FULL_46_32]|uniref:Uncharacterized protein n=1 Tax=Candidatus Giovannonibacteria bacterium RIFCSPLOWO2_01_FULL_46_32 TaxID=1798353 RepID=A0A1F5XH14_9BACT|nr:MAG: hypothetical protein A3B19_03240 [Candidatus Giovannonibacteria bacterium RIFCSPLOWO2_01_FULL_46_32]